MKDLINNIDKLIENHQMTIAELQNMKKAIIQEYQHKTIGKVGTMVMTAGEYRQFKMAYGQAVQDKLESFFFMGHEFVTNYAKYMIEYWDAK